jgi:hypothetical protein
MTETAIIQRLAVGVHGAGGGVAGAAGARGVAVAEVTVSSRGKASWAETI